MKIIKAEWLFDGENELRNKQAVVIKGNRIEAVLSWDELPSETGAETHYFPESTVMPGLIDCHIHVTSSGAADPTKERLEAQPLQTLRGADVARTLLEHGFTLVRNCGSSNHSDIALRTAVERGYVPGPRILASGMCITMTGGHGWMGGRQVDGPHEARKAAREQLRAGADLIKIMATGGVMTPGVEPGSAQLTIEEMRAAVEEAHKAGRKTATHAQGTQGIKNALLAGLDSIEHGIFLDDEVIAMMVERGVALVPTLVAPYHIVRGGVEAGIPDYAVEKSRRVIAAHTRSFQMALKAGVTIAMGTDCGTPLNRPGNNALEFELMVKAGMSPLQALIAGTKTGALVCDRPEVGTLASGQLADVIVVKGNPVDDITLLQDKANILRVIKDGKEIVKR